jgi:hypothetical protein
LLFNQPADVLGLYTVEPGLYGPGIMPGTSAARSLRIPIFGLGLICGRIQWWAHAADFAAEPPAAPGSQNLYLFLGLACFGLAGLLILRRLISSLAARRRRLRGTKLVWSRELPPKPQGFLKRWIGGNQSHDPVRLSSMEQRTRTAEQRAEQALAVLRSELAPHLADLMKDRLVWTLMSQRARLLNAHQASSEKVVALEHRLSAVQRQFRRQTDAYEQRIAQLEKDLKDKGMLTRELLKFRVRLARQALEAVRIGPDPVPSRH